MNVKFIKTLAIPCITAFSLLCLAEIVWITVYKREIESETIVLLMAFLVSITSLLNQIKSFEVDNARYNLSAIFDFISKEFSDRKTLSLIEFPEENFSTDILKVAQFKALESYDKNKSNWEELTSLNLSSWENKVAYETLNSLETVGMSVFSGALPIRILLLSMAGRILEEYKLCHYWIKSCREKENTKSIDGIDFHRRYGEWLVMLSVIWMDKYYPDYEHLSIVNRLQGGKCKLIEKFVKFTESEKENLVPNTEREILHLLKVKNIKDLLKK